MTEINTMEVPQEQQTYKPLKVPSRGYVRKRGTKELFAYSEYLMMRGDMILYNGPIPIPDNFVVPVAEIEIEEAIKKAEAGDFDPMKRCATTMYLRKLGTKDIFVATPSLLARSDMIPYDGMIPVPEGFIVPPQEMDILVFINKTSREIPISQLSEQPIQETTSINSIETDNLKKGLPPKTKLTKETREIKIEKIIECIKKMKPENFSLKTGKPDARIITKMLNGRQVIKEERDEAWDSYQRMNPIINQSIIDSIESPYEVINGTTKYQVVSEENETDEY